MKRAFSPMSISTIVVCLMVFVYAFSYPFARVFALRYLPRDCLPLIVKFYSPAHTIAAHCPPYATLLTWEMKLLGVDFN
jgi:hypothetical protein